MPVRKITTLSVAFAFAVLTASAIIATSSTTLLATGAVVSSGGITLEYPNYPFAGGGLQHCEPWNDDSAKDVTLSGVPAGSTVTLQFTFTSGIAGAPLIYPAPIVIGSVSDPSFSVGVPYPQDHTTWPYQNGTTSAIVVALAVRVTKPDGTVVRLNSTKWKVVCVPLPHDEGPFEGCSDGFWKQEQHFDSWTTYLPGDFFNSIFGVSITLAASGQDPARPDATLLQALEQGGGDASHGAAIPNGMARQAVGALLNASSPDVNYPLTVTEIINAVQTAVATNTIASYTAAHALFEGNNVLVTTYPDGTVRHCPLN